MPRPRSAGPGPAPDSAAAAESRVRRKKPEDTPAGCRALAAADFARAAEPSVDHARWRFRLSAETWMARAVMLDQLEAKFQEGVARARTSPSGPAAE